MKYVLASKLRYLNDEDLAKLIIEGTFKIPDELDEATKMILREIGKMSMKIMNEEGKEIVITPEDFTKLWKRVGKYTTSSASGIHYDHYKASTQLELSTKIHAQQLLVIVRSGIAPGCWGVCLQVMLENVTGIYLVKLLQSIQLYEVDLNFLQQFVFGQ